MRFLFILLLFLGANTFAQNEILAKEYFKNGDFKKALYEYKKLHKISPLNINHINKIITTHQQLEEYDEVETFLLELMQRKNYAGLLVELGYNYELKNDLENANLYYNKALTSIEINATNVYSVAKTFQNHSFLDKAIAAYEKATLIRPSFDFSLNLAKLYGEQGDIEKMFSYYINFVEANPTAISNIKYAINDFLSENSTNKNNILFRKTLLLKAQEEPNLLWNELLSWLFIQQKDFKKAFIQEKAIFNRKPESLNRIVELAKITADGNNKDTAKEIYLFVIEKAQDKETLLSANYNLLQIETKENVKKNHENIDAKYLNLFEEFGIFPQTLNLQISYAHFLAFNMNETDKATKFLEKTLKLSLSKTDNAKVKLELGDILILQEKFNQALIYYTQIQRNLKNSPISQEARYKVAKASYYKGDFKWAESEAINILNKILEAHKTEPIIPQALLKQAQLFEQKQDFEKAEKNYNAIITNYRDGILVDDAYYNLAELYTTHLDQPEKAKDLYEKIIFNHADSIYFVEARKKYRALRGDTINFS